MGPGRISEVESRCWVQERVATGRGEVADTCTLRRRESCPVHHLWLSETQFPSGSMTIDFMGRGQMPHLSSL